ncbi:unnamed protein product [Calicophoron daubneyi]|uniref:adenylate cyclase n=1 Tax=Calicophoron daubneyi TaxID=300641 RepID=A0AAV2TLU2_CALDB
MSDSKDTELVVDLSGGGIDLAEFAELSALGKIYHYQSEIIQFVRNDFALVVSYFHQVSYRLIVARLREAIRLFILFGILGMAVLSVNAVSQDFFQLCVTTGLLIIGYTLYWITLRIKSSRPCKKIAKYLLLQTVLVYLVLPAFAGYCQHTTFRNEVLLIVGISHLLPIKPELLFTITVLFLSGYLLTVRFWISNVARLHQDSFEFDIVPLVMSLLVSIYDMVIVRMYTVVRQRLTYLYLCHHVHSWENYEKQRKIQRRILKHVIPKKLVKQDKLCEHLSEPDLSPIQQVTLARDVSILCADLDGLHSLMAGKTMAEKVDILNRIFTLFDQSCELTECEKLVDLGSSYFAISGCPTENPLHAQCCVEMGLQICHAFKRLSREWKKSLRVRVGVTSGSVVYAIVGTTKPRFDIFSFDIMIAHQLQQTGLFGRVHVSQKVYQQCNHVYRFASGDDVDVLVGNETITVETYFVDPRSINLNLMHAKQADTSKLTQKALDFLRSLADISTETKIDTSGVSEVRRQSKQVIGSQVRKFWANAGTTDNVEVLGNIIQQYGRIKFLFQYLLTDILAAPRRFRQQYESPNVDPRFIIFRDSEVEWHFRNRRRDNTARGLLDCDDWTLCIDLCVVFIHNMLIYASFILFIHRHAKPEDRIFELTVWAGVVTHVVLFGFLVWVSLSPNNHSKESFLRAVREELKSPTVGELIVLGITVAPSVHLLAALCVLRLHALHDSISQNLVWSFQTPLLLTHVMPTYSRFGYRVIGAIVTVVAIIACDHLVFSGDCSKTENLWTDDICEYRRYLTCRWMEAMILILSIWACVRERDLLFRLLFYQRRRANCQSEMTKLTGERTKLLLRNIVPRQVCEHASFLADITKKPVGLPDFWVETVNAGIAFIRLSNFYSDHFQKDAKLALVSVRFLNKFICAIDQLIVDSPLEGIEKIKSSSDGYLLASGLWIELSSEFDTQSHLVALMEFCFLVLNLLTQFNDENFGNQIGFKLSIGYHSGPILGGIAGLSRLAFDVWGETVSVAKLLVSSNILNEIEVMDQTVQLLKNRYEFVQNGEVTTKLGETVPVYGCKAKLYARNIHDVKERETTSTASPVLRSSLLRSSACDADRGLWTDRVIDCLLAFTLNFTTQRMTDEYSGLEDD